LNKIHENMFSKKNARGINRRSLPSLST